MIKSDQMNQNKRVYKRKKNDECNDGCISLHSDWKVFKRFIYGVNKMFVFFLLCDLALAQTCRAPGVKRLGFHFKKLF